jgi:hypothetical protein
MHDAVVEPLADSLRELGPDVPFLVDGLCQCPSDRRRDL